MLKRLANSRPVVGVAIYCALTAAAQSNNPPRANTAGNYRIAGTVVSKIDGHPLDHARVLLVDSKSNKEPLSAVTSEDGKFSFENVSAGKYALEGRKRGFINAAYDQHEQFSTAIVTGAGLDTENLVLRLSPAALISGRVLDEAGEPVRQAQVTLYRNNHFQGVDQIQIVRSAQTDDLGAYEVAPLMPGTYFLAVHAQPWYAVHPSAVTDRDSGGSARPNSTADRSLDVAYPLTYYQNATDPDGATPIQIRGGERLQIDISLSPVPSLRLIFHVQKSQNGAWNMPHLEEPVFDGTTTVQTTVQQVSPGLVEMTGVPAGRYNIQIQGENTTSELNGVDLTKDGEEVETSAAESVGTVKFSATVSGETVMPPGLGVGLTHARAALRGFRPFSPKGEAEFPQVSAGTYDVRILGGGKLYVIVGMSADGAQVKGHSITVPAGASATVALTLSLGVQVQGIAKKAGKPFPEAMVVLVPKNPEENHDLFRRDQSDLDGTFSLRSVVPGSYTLVAIEDGWDLEWSRPEVIAPYLKRGQRIEVRGEGSPTIQVKEAVEVQPKYSFKRCIEAARSRFPGAPTASRQSRPSETDNVSRHRSSQQLLCCSESGAVLPACRRAVPRRRRPRGTHSCA